MREEPISVWMRLEEDWTRDFQDGKRTKAVCITKTVETNNIKIVDTNKTKSKGTTDINSFVSITDINESLSEKERRNSRSSNSVIKIFVSGAVRYDVTSIP